MGSHPAVIKSSSWLCAQGSVTPGRTQGVDVGPHAKDTCFNSSNVFYQVSLEDRPWWLANVLGHTGTGLLAAGFETEAATCLCHHLHLLPSAPHGLGPSARLLGSCPRPRLLPSPLDLPQKGPFQVSPELAKQLPRAEFASFRLFLGRLYPTVLCTLKSLLEGSGPYEMPGIKLELAVCRANALLLCYHSGPAPASVQSCGQRYSPHFLYSPFAGVSYEGFGTIVKGQILREGGSATCLAPS